MNNPGWLLETWRDNMENHMVQGSWEKSTFTVVDSSFWNPVYMQTCGPFELPKDYQTKAASYPVAFPLCKDIHWRMTDAGKGVDVGHQILFCKKSFRTSTGSKSVPACLNKCMYFGFDGQEGFTHLLGACLSFELSEPEATVQGLTSNGRKFRHAFLSMTSAAHEDGCTFPFMVAFNSRRPGEIMLIGENRFDRIQPAQISNLEWERLAASNRPWPSKRSLGGMFWDRIMPVPHLRMYMVLRRNSGTGVKRWEQLGHIGDLVSAYQVHLEDGTADFVLARSRMEQLDVLPTESLLPEVTHGTQNKGGRNRNRKKKDNSATQEPAQAEEPPAVWDEQEFPTLQEAGRRKNRKKDKQDPPAVQQRLVFEDVGDYDEDLLLLGDEFDLGGFSSELEDEEDSSSFTQPFSAGAPSNDIWQAAAVPAAAPWARSWLRPVVRGD